MALPPRLIPFPWEDIFITAAWDNHTALDAFVQNTDNRGATLVSYLSDTADWADFSPGLELPGGFPAAYWPTKELVSGAYSVAAWYFSVGLDGVPELADANTTTDQWWTHWSTGVITGTPYTGEHVFPGCLGTNANGGYAYLTARWKNRPILYEQYFIENTARPNPLWGFNGYTVFGDQMNCGPASYSDPPADIWRRRHVVGIIKRTADLATCGPEDIMLGVLITSDGTTTTMRLCCNGAVLNTSTSPTIYGGGRAYPLWNWDAGWTWFESAWDGPASEVEVWPGFVDEFQASVDQGVGWYSLSQFSSPGDPLSITIAGYDTYDVKWAWYIDDTSATHPVDTIYDVGPSGPLQYQAYPPAMTALHGPLPPPPVYDFWQDFVMSRETMSV